MRDSKYERVTQGLVQVSLGIQYEYLPSTCVEKIKWSLLDSVGCMLAGAVTDRGRIAIEHMKDMGGRPQATVVGVGRTSIPTAAFCNSELMNSLDYDYIGPISGHIAPYVMTPCIALAESLQVSGKELILALALANEIGGRSVSAFAQHKIATNAPPWYEEHPRFTYASSVFGGVIGAGRLVGLNQEALENAIGIAGASTAVPATMKWQHMSGPAIMTKYNAWTGWVSQLATMAVLSAEKGFTGDRTILDGEFGYWNIVGSPKFDVDNLMGGLGQKWHLDDIRFKLYPTCYIYHAGIQGIGSLIRDNGIMPDDIDEIVVYGDKLMQTPNRMGVEVNSFADAQFFIKFNYALAVFHEDSPDPNWQMPSVYADPRIHSMISRVRLKVHPEFEGYVRDAIGKGSVPILWSSIVEIRCGEKTYQVEVPAPKGSSSLPATDGELLQKFMTNASYSTIRPARIQSFVNAVGDLENLSDVSKVFQYLHVNS